jgi:hypothetical protein
MSANSAVLLRDRNQLRIPKITPVGEVWLFIDLAQVDSHTPEQVAEMAIALGYSPELRIAEYIRHGKPALEPVLLVYHAVQEPSDILLDHWEQLSTQIHPSTAVHLRSGQPLAA